MGDAKRQGGNAFGMKTGKNKKWMLIILPAAVAMLFGVFAEQMTKGESETSQKESETVERVEIMQGRIRNQHRKICRYQFL